LLKRSPGDDHIEASGSNADPVPETDGFGDDEYVPALERTPPVESVLTWDVVAQERIRIAELLRKHPKTDDAKHQGLVSVPSAVTQVALAVFHPIVLHHLLTLEVGSEVVRSSRGAAVRAQLQAADAGVIESKRNERACGDAIDAVAHLIVRPEGEREREGEQEYDEHACSVYGDEAVDRAIAETDKDTLTRRYAPDPTWKQGALDELLTKPAPTGPPDDSYVRGVVEVRRQLASNQAAHRRRWSLASFHVAHLRANYDAIGAGKRPSSAESAIITLRLGALVDGLRAAGWTMERIADLIIASATDWVPPPCSGLVAQWSTGKRGTALAGTSWVEKRWQRAR
jgi:hypothetical protein